MKRLLNLAPIVIDMNESTASFSRLSIGGKAARSIPEQTDTICLREYTTHATIDTCYVDSYFWLHKICFTGLHPIFEALPFFANCQLKIKQDKALH